MNQLIVYYDYTFLSWFCVWLFSSNSSSLKLALQREKVKKHHTIKHKKSHKPKTTTQKKASRYTELESHKLFARLQHAFLILFQETEVKIFS